MSSADLPRHFFDRADESPDALFYGAPRLVTHIDDATIDALTALYAERLAAFSPDGAVLDLMSSWVSHLPAELPFARVVGLGMNAAELDANPRLDDAHVKDLNASPALPFADASFDAVLNAVSVQYLVEPVAVFAEVARVLRPGGISLVAMSHRCFPTKAVRAFQQLPPAGRLRLVSSYHELAGGFDEPEPLDRSPAGADPLWVVIARRCDQ